jgi:16S rRNA (cytidine1402-2'-O)-methyltransferase
VTGRLVLVSTPIGNLGDLSDRAREALGRADVVACEDTRRTRALLTHIGVRGARLVSFFEANEAKRTPELLALLRDGRDVALVSNAGMPALSDPGYRLVAACADEEIEVDVIPGPSAPVSALIVSGLPTDRFVFEGFLPRRPGRRRKAIEALRAEGRTIVLFESPMRLGATLGELAEVLGGRRAAVVRELTKKHQEVLRGTLPELAERVGERVKGEVTVVVEGLTRRSRR